MDKNKQVYSINVSEEDWNNIKNLFQPMHPMYKINCLWAANYLNIIYGATYSKIRFTPDNNSVKIELTKMTENKKYVKQKITMTKVEYFKILKNNRCWYYNGQVKSYQQSFLIQFLFRYLIP